ncbi:MAG: hypothetical protein ABIQ10_05365 [Gemmatimonadaceae bacterium]
MKTLLVLPATARLSVGDDVVSRATTERVAGAWVGFLLSGTNATDSTVAYNSEKGAETIDGISALNSLKTGDIVFTGRSTADTVGIAIDRDAEILSYTGSYGTPARAAGSEAAKAISRTLEFLRQ